MLTNYMVYAMTRKDYTNYMNGSWDYHIIKLSVLAEDPYEATLVAEHEHPDLAITNYVKSMKKVLEERKEEEEKAIAYAEQQKEEERIKAVRLAKKAQNMGMTVEDYTEYKKAHNNWNRHMRELKKAKATIEEMEKKIKYEERKLAEYEEKVKKYENRA